MGQCNLGDGSVFQPGDVVKHRIDGAIGVVERICNEKDIYNLKNRFGFLDVDPKNWIYIRWKDVFGKNPYFTTSGKKKLEKIGTANEQPNLTIPKNLEEANIDLINRLLQIQDAKGYITFVSTDPTLKRLFEEIEKASAERPHLVIELAKKNREIINLSKPNIKREFIKDYTLFTKWEIPSTNKGGYIIYDLNGEMRWLQVFRGTSTWYYQFSDNHHIDDKPIKDIGMPLVPEELIKIDQFLISSFIRTNNRRFELILQLVMTNKPHIDNIYESLEQNGVLLDAVNYALTKLPPNSDLMEVAVSIIKRDITYTDQRLSQWVLLIMSQKEYSLIIEKLASAKNNLITILYKSINAAAEDNLDFLQDAIELCNQYHLSTLSKYFSFFRNITSIRDITRLVSIHIDNQLQDPLLKLTKLIEATEKIGSFVVKYLVEQDNTKQRDILEMALAVSQQQKYMEQEGPFASLNIIAIKFLGHSLKNKIDSLSKEAYLFFEPVISFIEKTNQWRLELVIINKSKFRPFNMNFGIYDANNSLLETRKLASMTLSQEILPFYINRMGFGGEVMIKCAYHDGTGAHEKIIRRSLTKENIGISEKSKSTTIGLSKLDLDDLDISYPERNPIKESENFFGREEDIEVINEYLKKDSCIIVTGLRKMGKTSLAYYLCEKGLQSNYIPVYITFEDFAYDITSDSKFYYNVIKSIKMEFEKLSSRYIKDTKNQFQAVHLNEDEYEKYPFETFKKHISFLESKAVGKKIVLIFDEFILLKERFENGILSPLILNSLRSLYQDRNHSIKLIFISPPAIIDWMERNEAFYGVQRRILSNFFYEKDALDFIRNPIQKYKGITFFDVGVMEYIVNLCNKYPSLIATVCNRLFLQLKIRQDSTLLPIQKIMVDEIVESLISNTRTEFQMFDSFWNIDIPEKEFRSLFSCLAYLMDEDKPVSIELLKRELSNNKIVIPNIAERLDKLCNEAMGKFLNKEVSTELKYYISLPLLRKWINKWHNFKEEILKED